MPYSTTPARPPGAVPRAAQLRVHGDAHDAPPAEGREVWVLELLADGPGDEVALRQLALGQRVDGGALRDGALQRHL